MCKCAMCTANTRPKVDRQKYSSCQKCSTCDGKSVTFNNRKQLNVSFHVVFMQCRVISLYSCLPCFDETHKKNQMMFKTEEKLLTSAIFGGLAEHTLFGFSFPPCSQISCFIAHYGTQCGAGRLNLRRYRGIQQILEIYR